MKYIESFGLRLYVLNIICKIFAKINKKSLFTKCLFDKKHYLIKKRLTKDFNDIIKKYKTFDISLNSNKNVWIFWWQGIESAPSIVKSCINSIKKYSNNVIILDKNNYDKYIELENFILEKVEKGLISITHLSDIIRMKLLKKYGGYWIDSTIFLTDNIFEKIENSYFYTPKLNENDNYISVSKGKWCGFFIGGENNYLYSFVDSIFVEYWNKYDILIDYFLIDYCISLAYDNFEQIRELIDNNNYNNERIFDLNDIKNLTYDEIEYRKLIKYNMIHKLSYKDLLDNKNNTFYEVVIKDE